MRKRMKKLTSLVAVICTAALILSGCGGKSGKASESVVTPAAEAAADNASDPAEAGLENAADSTGDSAENAQDQEEAENVTVTPEASGSGDTKDSSGPSGTEDPNESQDASATPETGEEGGSPETDAPAQGDASGAPESGSGEGSSAAVEILEGEEGIAPDYYNALASFTAADLDGNPVTEDIFSGTRLTMVNVWGTFCGPCINEMPDLAKIAGAYDASEFQIIGIVSDAIGWDGEADADTVALARDIISETGADYLHLVPTGELLDLLYNLQYVPTTVFVNAEGRVISEEYVGSRSEEDWQAIIQGLLNP